MPKTVHWRGVDVDPITADMLAAIAKAAGDDIYVRGIPGFGSYRSNAASAGTDSGGGHADLSMIGYSDEQCRRLETTARSMGACAYWRPERRPDGTRYGWQNHVHVLRMDCADLSPAARSQVADYLAGYDGLYYPDGKHKDTGTRSYTGRRWLTLSASLGGPNLTPSKPIAATQPAPKEDDMAISDADAEKIAQKVLGYKNAKVNGTRDLYQVITDGSLWRDQVPAPNKDDKKNPTWMAMSYLRELFLQGQRIEQAVKAMADPASIAKAIVSALPTGQQVTQGTVEAALRNVLSSLAPDDAA